MIRKCPECVKLNQKSTVYSKGSSRTLMGVMRYWDEDGFEHNHDPNAIRTHYSCSMGHSWEDNYKFPCPTKECAYNR